MVDGSIELIAEILRAALDTWEEGVAVLDRETRVLFWNPAAAEISGYRSVDLLLRMLPEDFYQVESRHSLAPATELEAQHQLHLLPRGGTAERPVLVTLLHQRGHSLPAMLRRIPLRDALGELFGTLLRFHPTEEVDALPRGGMDEDGNLDKHVEHSQAEMEDRLDEAWHAWTTSQVPFGLLWITVDQAAMLRKTHGRDASEAMLEIVERTLLHALRPTEILGRWGSNEFLVLCHERTPQMLMLHARHVGGFARTSDFRWWGDRVSLTVSVGAAQARQDEKLADLLKRAQRAMQASQTAGGNEVVLQEKSLSDNGGLACSQS